MLGPNAHRPHVMYIVPIGQNPSGAVSCSSLVIECGSWPLRRPWGRPGNRKSTIFVLNMVRSAFHVLDCLISPVIQQDVIIVEDDPYFFLQEGPYDPKAQRKLSKVDSDSDYLRKLSPSFLK